MACSSSTCQSGCYKEEEDDVVSSNRCKGNQELNGSKLLDRKSICVKCKIREGVAGGAGGGEDGRFCAECFRGSLFGKFRLAVTSNAMILPSDKVLVAFSGGPSSRVVLQFVHEMQLKAQKNFDASRDKSVPVFGVGVAFIDESSAYGFARDEMDRAIEQMSSVISELFPPEKELYVAPIEDIYFSNLTDGRDRLKGLLTATKDTTGREDLILYLRMLSLEKIAVENGYTKLVLGTCTSRIARQVITATVKGQGYSLPADIQCVDARWEIPVLLPLRDCMLQELNTLCQLDGFDRLKTVNTIVSPCSGINALVSSFISLLQEENPSRECTIVRTAGKLTPFGFNKIPDVDSPQALLATQKRQKKYNLNYSESTLSESFCSLCNSPLSKSHSSIFDKPTNSQLSSNSFVSTCCQSCRLQILPNDPSTAESYYSLLPRPITSRSEVASSSNSKWVMEKIQEFLLSDNED
ncbi:hypothetical protein V2J09_007944 [Rumex salicifolius]